MIFLTTSLLIRSDSIVLLAATVSTFALVISFSIILLTCFALGRVSLILPCFTIASTWATSILIRAVVLRLNPFTFRRCLILFLFPFTLQRQFVFRQLLADFF